MNNNCCGGSCGCSSSDGLDMFNDEHEESALMAQVGEEAPAFMAEA